MSSNQMSLPDIYRQFQQAQNSSGACLEIFYNELKKMEQIVKQQAQQIKVFTEKVEEQERKADKPVKKV